MTRRPSRRTRVRTPASFDDADAELGAVLHSLEHAHNYLDWLADLFRPHITGDTAEIGAGTGTITARLEEMADTVRAVEPSNAAFAQLDERFVGHSTVTCVLGDHTSLGVASCDSILMSNVLEHIEDDLGTLTELRTSLRPGGSLIVFSPAFEALYSDFDRRVGHYRRYRKAEIVNRFEAAGLTVVDARYLNALGGCAWFVYARLLRRNPTNDGSLSAWDRFVIPMIRFVENRVRLPFGQSVLIVGRWNP
jgi:SAM-dependent methyltransferase